ncbi:type II toxin-antitoxin system VapC family toxin [Microbacterium dauci]|uniref:Ribonuclease VapC n=1 Tax=Microbacterium dauci TaxID=3048008 RepID=A0ABT6ZDR6_9MICO|nr:type II toxin-antitoxin system VapC family toxin [Microbacterium sp. LX3-4]MDJ1113777.1 type II toxin-antitoxin system VapC family toxin [Microbacterium sp. LX3-4]
MIVVDASVIVNGLADDEVDGRIVRDRLASEDMIAPALLDVEVLSVLRRKWLSGDIDDARFDAAARDLVALPVQRYPMVPLVHRAVQLRSNLTAYDAMYVALAEAVGSTLVTGDRRLAAAPGLRCTVELLSGPA